MVLHGARPPSSHPGPGARRRLNTPQMMAATRVSTQRGGGYGGGGDGGHARGGVGRRVLRQYKGRQRSTAATAFEPAAAMRLLAVPLEPLTAWSLGHVRLRLNHTAPCCRSFRGKSDGAATLPPPPLVWRQSEQEQLWSSKFNSGAMHAGWPPVNSKVVRTSVACCFDAATLNLRSHSTWLCRHRW